MTYQAQNQPQTVGEYFKTTKIMFGAFILGVVNFGIVIGVLYFLEILPLSLFDDELLIYFILASIALLVIMTFTGNSIYKKLTSVSKTETSFTKKLEIFRKVKLIQIITIEVSALVALVFLMLTLHVIFLVVAMLSLIQMIRVFPKKSELIKSLDLSYADQQKLNNPDFVIA